MKFYAAIQIATYRKLGGILQSISIWVGQKGYELCRESRKVEHISKGWEGPFEDDIPF